MRDGSVCGPDSADDDELHLHASMILSCVAQEQIRFSDFYLKSYVRIPWFNVRAS